mgnify:FL=1
MSTNGIGCGNPGRIKPWLLPIVLEGKRDKLRAVEVGKFPPFVQAPAHPTQTRCQADGSIGLKNLTLHGIWLKMKPELWLLEEALPGIRQ